MICDVKIVKDLFNNYFIKIDEKLLIPLKPNDFENLEYFLKRK